MSAAAVLDSVEVPARGGGACTVRQGQGLKVVDLEGQQVVDLIAFNLGTPREEKLSGAHTANFNLDVRASVGAFFWSDLPRPMFEIVADDANGVHDYFYAACSREQYELQTGDSDHPNCRQNLTRAVEPFGLTMRDLPHPINLFQHTFLRDDGTVDAAPPVTKAGDSIVLRALIDVLVAVSACPWDSGDVAFGKSINGDGPTPIRIEVLDRA